MLDAEEQAAAHPGTAPATYVAQLDRAALATISWDVVADTLKSTYGFEQGATPSGIIGSVKHDLDPVAQKTGTLDGPGADELIAARALIRVSLPLFPADVAALHRYIAAHNVEKPDIWAARNVTLAPAQVKAPVVIGIWDSGVDPSDYPGQMFVDAAGRHGLAADPDGTPSTSMLYPLPGAVAAKYKRFVALETGQSDAGAAVDSPEAAAYYAYKRSLSADAAARFDFALDQIGEYSHGSHVAGIAVLGNPGARIAVARFDDNLPDLTFAPTGAWIERMSAYFGRVSAYLRTNHARVINMSWGDDVDEFESWLAKTSATPNAQTRKHDALALFSGWRSAIERVIANNPATLFVTSAGNGDNDTSFSANVPSALSYPNMIAVGAVNQAGDATNFTSYGPTVAVFADGFRVPSKVPGGYTVKYNGTSMAAPNVTNLAAKLFALDPALSPGQVRTLIIEGATLSADGKRRLIDPRRSVALLQQMRRDARRPASARGG